MITSLTSKEKARILKTSKEYLFIELYNFNYKLVFTNDNASKYINIINNNNWLNYLFYMDELKTILTD